METPATCPRGHVVAPDAVLCTVCWVRLDGEDPASKRARILRVVSTPLVAVVVGGVVLAAGVGASLLLADPTAPPAVVAGEAALPVASPSASPSEAAEQPTVTSVPLAATVVAPVVTGPDGGCTLTTLEQQATCRTEGELVRFEVCVPAETSAVVVRTRQSADDEWTDAAADVVLLPGGDCGADGVRADIALAAEGFTVSETAWRLVGRDSGGDKLWKSKVRPAG